MGIFQTQVHTAKTGEKITIRTAKQMDASKLNALVEDVFKTSQYLITSPEEFSSFTKDQQRERIKKYAMDEGSLILVAEYQHNLIGMLDFKNGKRKRISHRGAFGMSIRSSWRNKGIGALLLDGLISWVRQHPHIEVINLGVVEANHSALKLYSKMGFKKTGREPFALKLPDGSFLADISMSLRVDK